MRLERSLTRGNYVERSVTRGYCWKHQTGENAQVPIAARWQTKQFRSGHTLSITKVQLEVTGLEQSSLNTDAMTNGLGGHGAGARHRCRCRCRRSVVQLQHSAAMTHADANECYLGFPRVAF